MVFLLLMVMQVGFALHTRNVLVSAAQEGARFGANVDRGPGDAQSRALAVVAQSLSAGVASRLTATAKVVTIDGVTTMEVTLSGPLPLVLLPAGPLDITVRGHALEEG